MIMSEASSEIPLLRMPLLTSGNILDAVCKTMDVQSVVLHVESVFLHPRQKQRFLYKHIIHKPPCLCGPIWKNNQSCGLLFFNFLKNTLDETERWKRIKL